MTFYFISYINVYGKGVGITFFFSVYFGTAYNEVYEKAKKKNLNGKGNTVKIHTIKNVGTCFVVFVRNILMVDFFFYIYLSNSLLIKCAGRIFKQQKKIKIFFLLNHGGWNRGHQPEGNLVSVCF